MERSNAQPNQPDHISNLNSSYNEQNSYLPDQRDQSFNALAPFNDQPNNGSFIQHEVNNVPAITPLFPRFNDNGNDDLALRISAFDENLEEDGGQTFRPEVVYD